MELANHIKSSVVLKVVMLGSIAYKNNVVILQYQKLKYEKRKIKTQSWRLSYLL